MTLRAVDAGPPGVAAGAASALPTPLAPSAAPPRAHDLRLFETAATAPVPSGAGSSDDSGAGPSDGSGGRRSRRRRKGMLLSAAGAVVVVVGAAGYASGLFSYEAPSRDGALPEEVRAGVPDPSPSEATPTSGTSATPVPQAGSAAPSPSASASASASPSASPSPSASSASPSPSRSAEPTPSATSTATEKAPQESEDDDHDFYGGSLRRGDRGPEVVELQQRLAQLYLYTGDIDGNYDHRVEDAVRTYQWARGIRSDDLGVYGPDTRRQLESETREP
ncbi:peptidoglycan-binding domain-containing protein [Streptomyces sp. Tu 4128]|uniref:peptidoglycan-binding domain-containing protein n=1 Tax=Streptomyces sp. Tu 4128 TaxID=1120314 RepID=UPI001F120E1E|nr:peptidoglycan-binding domain-containing protein [Streptomyces sp. Tu 4128]